MLVRDNGLEEWDPTTFREKSTPDYWSKRQHVVVVTMISHKPASSRIVQSYLPGGANVHCAPSSNVMIRWAHASSSLKRQKDGFSHF